jgi:hypothetical protein
MPKIHKTIQKQNLSQYQVWIEDTDPKSAYFQLSQIPDVLTTGKNSFLIHGSPYLQDKTDIRVELIDSDGNSIFVLPIKNYNEGLARLISIEVYEDAAPGLATLILMGVATRSTDGQLPPDRFKASYNVRWQTKINIDLTRSNTTPIRLYKKPTLSVSESLMQWRPATQPQTIVSGGAVLTGNPFQNPGGNELYTIKLSNVTNNSVLFNRYGQEGTVTAVINGVTFITSISAVLNSTTAFLSSSYTSSSSPVPFVTTNFTMSFADAQTYSTSSLLRSFASINIDHLTTFSGKVHRAKVFVKSADSTTDYERIGDVVIEPKEFMVTHSSDGVNIKTGEIHNQSIVNTYWVSGAISNIALYNG